MSYRIRAVPEVEAWLDQLRDSDPGAAAQVDQALDTLREAGVGLGPPLVVPMPEPAPELPHHLDYSYQRQLEVLTRARRGVADVATSRKRIELQITQLEEHAERLAAQRRGGTGLAGRELGELDDLQSSVSRQLAELRPRQADLAAQEQRLAAASRRLQLKVDDFRTRKESIKAAETALEATVRFEAAAAEIDQVIAAGDAAMPAGAVPPASAPPRRPEWTRQPMPELSELRPGALGLAGIRILFTVDPSGTAVLLAAGAERDWLRAWYAEAPARCRVRYERDQRSTG